ncbi:MULTISPECIES: hypothetical protein [unclassified Halomonas]|uniref:hypothetical protein n=1 Tax=unclassified Halomonas TaxID=2609666 RepID=UPI00246928DE|nr:MULTISPECIES: hypothetical protein [unclassified Halomonas]
MDRGLTGHYVDSIADGWSALEHFINDLPEATGQKRNRIYAYRGYIDILNQDTP